MSLPVKYGSNTHWTMSLIAGKPKTMANLLSITQRPQWKLSRGIEQLVKSGLVEVEQGSWYPHYSLTHEGVGVLWDLPQNASTNNIPYNTKGMI